MPSHRFLNVVESMVLDAAKDADEVEAWRAEIYEPPVEDPAPPRKKRFAQAPSRPRSERAPRRRPMTAEQARRVATNLDSWAKEVGDE